MKTRDPKVLRVDDGNCAVIVAAGLAKFLPARAVVVSPEDADVRHRGVGKVDLPTETAAQQLRTTWASSKVPVRYNPRRPARSYLDPFRDGAGLTTAPRPRRT